MGVVVSAHQSLVEQTAGVDFLLVVLSCLSNISLSLLLMLGGVMIAS